MSLINLKETTNLGRLLQKINLSSELAESIKNEIPYFDEYYLTPDWSRIKVFRQEFRKDSYMKLNPIPIFRLITYPDNITVRELEDIFNEDTIPIITRAKGTMIQQLNAPGFNHIENRYGNHETKLFPIKFSIPISLYEIKVDRNICHMAEQDLEEIEELFKNEYSLRYKMVRIMHYDCPEACFVYKDKGSILGVTFNKVVGNELYMRQIFVKEKFRDKGIGRILYERRLEFARRHNLTTARGNIRMEARLFHEQYNPIRDEKNMEYYIIRS